MSAFRFALIVAFGAALAGLAGDVGAAAASPRVAKPRPVPPTLPTIPPLPPATFDPTLAVGGQDVKAREVETRLSVEVLVNGRGPYHFIVDSGADTSVIGSQIARQLQLPLGKPVILNGMTSRDVVDSVKVAELTLGPTTMHNLELPALNEADLGAQGMVGIDALHRHRLLMDFEKHLIRIEDARAPEKGMPGDIVVVARRRRGQLILTQVKAAGTPLDAIIDTGTEITIGNLALRDKLIRGNRGKFVDVEVTGVTGVVAHMQVARIAELQLGPVLLRDVPMAFADVPPFKLFGLSREPALLLGTDLLENFRRVSLDFRTRKVRFQLRRCGSEGIIISTSPRHFTRLSSAGTADVCGN